MSIPNPPQPTQGGLKLAPKDIFYYQRAVASPNYQGLGYVVWAQGNGAKWQVASCSQNCAATYATFLHIAQYNDCSKYSVCLNCFCLNRQNFCPTSTEKSLCDPNVLGQTADPPTFGSGPPISPYVQINISCAQYFQAKAYIPKQPRFNNILYTLCTTNNLNVPCNGNTANGIVAFSDDLIPGGFARAATICGTDATNYNGRILDCCRQVQGLTVDLCGEYWGNYTNAPIFTPTTNYRPCDQYMLQYCSNFTDAGASTTDVACNCINYFKSKYVIQGASANSFLPECASITCRNNVYAYKTAPMVANLNANCIGVVIIDCSNTLTVDGFNDIIKSYQKAVCNITVAIDLQKGTIYSTDYPNKATVQPCPTTDPNYPNCTVPNSQGLPGSSFLIIVVIVVVGIILGMVLLFFIFRYMSKKKASIYLQKKHDIEEQQENQRQQQQQQEQYEERQREQQQRQYEDREREERRYEEERNPYNQQQPNTFGNNYNY